MTALIDRWLFAPVDPRRLAAVRIGLAGILVVRASRSIYADLAEQPAALFRPLSFMHAFDAMPGPGIVRTVQIIGIGAAVLAVVGWRTRLALPVAWAAGVFLGGMTTSLGKVVHNDVMVLLAMVPLLFAHTSHAWAADARGRSVGPHERYAWPVRASMLTIGLVYLLTGIPKMVNSGLAWATSDNLRWVLYAASDASAMPNRIALFVADRPVLAHLIAGSVLAFELTFVLAVFFRRLRWVYVPGAVAFTIGIRLMLGLDYWPWAASVLVVFVDWPRVVDAVRERTSSSVNPAVGRSAPSTTS